MSDDEYDEVDGVRFDRTDEGQYRISQPIGGMEPEEVALKVEGDVYTFHGYAGKECRSRFQPDVLLFEDVSVTTVDAWEES